MKITTQRRYEISFALTIIYQMSTVSDGDILTPKKAKETAIKVWNDKFLTREEVFAYFKQKEWLKKDNVKSGIPALDEPTPEWADRDMSTRQWEALEYFGLI